MQGCRNANTRGAQFCICASVDASLPHHIKSRFNEPLSNSMPAGSGALDRAQGFIRTAIRGNVECERPASVLVLNLITNSINTLLDDFSAEQAAALLVLLRAKQSWGTDAFPMADAFKYGVAQGEHIRRLPDAHSVQYAHKLTSTRRAIENKNTQLWCPGAACCQKPTRPTPTALLPSGSVLTPYMGETPEEIAGMARAMLGKALTVETSVKRDGDGARQCACALGYVWSQITLPRFSQGIRNLDRGATGQTFPCQFRGAPTTGALKRASLVKSNKPFAIHTQSQPLELRALLGCCCLVRASAHVCINLKFKLLEEHLFASSGLGLVLAVTACA
eukprot:1160740-Pelagomonas_calceolata.AAC.6